MFLPCFQVSASRLNPSSHSNSLLAEYRKSKQSSVHEAMVCCRTRYRQCCMRARLRKTLKSSASSSICHLSTKLSLPKSKVLPQYRSKLYPQDPCLPPPPQPQLLQSWILTCTSPWTQHLNSEHISSNNSPVTHFRPLKSQTPIRFHHQMMNCSCLVVIVLLES